MIFSFISAAALSLRQKGGFALQFFHMPPLPLDLRIQRRVNFRSIGIQLYSVSSV